MTMLDRMRRHKNWLKWSLFIVVIAFVFLYIPSFMPQDGMPAGANDVVATVDGREITVSRFRRVYMQQMQAYRNQFGGKMDERLLKQLGIDQRIVQQMVEEEASLAEAQKLGITASNEEVIARIRSLPAFQENGQFIGETRYRQVLNMQNPPLRADEFEEQVRRGITMEKLQGALTDWITVTEPEVDAEFRRRNEKVKLERRELRRRQVPRGHAGHRRGSLGLVRLAQGRLQDSREAQDQVRAPRHAGDPQPHPGLR